jgi:hypothetical protein
LKFVKHEERGGERERERREREKERERERQKSITEEQMKLKVLRKERHLNAGREREHLLVQNLPGFAHSRL